MTQPTTDLVGTLGANDELTDLEHLARALGGDASSFTGWLLQLIGKADQQNRDRLRLAYPRAVGAYELWELPATDHLTAGDLNQWLDLDPVVQVLINSGEELLKLTALRSALARSGFQAVHDAVDGHG